MKSRYPQSSLSVQCYNQMKLELILPVRKYGGDQRILCLYSLHLFLRMQGNSTYLKFQIRRGPLQNRYVICLKCMRLLHQLSVGGATVTLCATHKPRTRSSILLPVRPTHRCFRGWDFLRFYDHIILRLYHHQIGRQRKFKDVSSLLFS